MRKILKFVFIFVLFFSSTLLVNAATYYVTGTGVRVRSTPENKDNNIIGKLNYGDIIDVIELDHSWYKIKYNDGYGYITYRYVSVLENSYVTNTIALLKEKANLKKSYSSSSSNLTTMPKGAVVKVLKERNDWAFVQYNEKLGFIQVNKLQKYTKSSEKVVGAWTINYSLNNSSRKKNIAKSMSKLNNVVIKPNEKFSFIKTVGKSGYLKAPEFKKSKKVLGGGLSEVSTSLYLTLRDAQRNTCNINITEQNRYGTKTPYAKLGEEAMIDLKRNKDLVFVNKSGKTIKIYSNVNDNNVSFVVSMY